MSPIFDEEPFIVQCPDGRFLALLQIPGTSPPSTYATRTEDAADATDFKTAAAAGKWAKEKGGAVRVLNEDGSWPLED